MISWNVRQAKGLQHAPHVNIGFWVHAGTGHFRIFGVQCRQLFARLNSGGTDEIE